MVQTREIWFRTKVTKDMWILTTEIRMLSRVISVVIKLPMATVEKKREPGHILERDLQTTVKEIVQRVQMSEIEVKTGLLAIAVNVDIHRAETDQSPMRDEGTSLRTNGRETSLCNTMVTLHHLREVKAKTDLDIIAVLMHSSQVVKVDTTVLTTAVMVRHRTVDFEG